MSFVDATYIITNTFTRTIDTDKIKDDVIEAQQWDKIRPVLTENLYDDVVDNESDYTTLIDDYIKPALAWWVKLAVLPEVYVEITDRGIDNLDSEFGTTVNSAVLNDYQNKTMETARMLTDKLKDYVKKQEYDLYEDTTDIDEEQQIIGGLLID